MTGVIVGLGALAVLGAGGPLQGWLVPSTQKVYPDTMPPGKAQAVEVYAARGEYEAVQLALRSSEDLADVRVAVVPAARGKAALLSPRWVEMFDEVYLATPADKVHPITPDPLVPIGDKGISLKAGETRAVWVRIKVPEAAEAGTYSADVLAGEFLLIGGVYRTEKGSVRAHADQADGVAVRAAEEDARADGVRHRQREHLPDARREVKARPRATALYASLLRPPAGPPYLRVQRTLRLLRYAGREVHAQRAGQLVHAPVHR